MIGRTFFKVFLFSLFLCFIGDISYAAYESGDWQYWNTEAIEVGFAKKFKIKTEEKLRFRDNIRELYYLHTDIGLGFKAFDWLSLSANYRLIHEKKNNKWVPTSQPHINGTLKYEEQGFSISDNNRLEYRILQNKTNEWRYRNKISFTFPSLYDKLKLKPYIADEVFIECDSDGLSRNRLFAGIKFDLLKHIKCDLYYMWQTSKIRENGWLGYNIIGTKLKLVF